MNFLPVLLWSDLLIWLLLFAALALAWQSSRNPPLRAAWRRVGRSRAGMAAATVLIALSWSASFDSLHYRPRLESRTPSETPAYAIEVLSLLDHLAMPLRTQRKNLFGPAGHPRLRQGDARHARRSRACSPTARVSAAQIRRRASGRRRGACRRGHRAPVLLAEALAALIFVSLALCSA